MNRRDPSNHRSPAQSGARPLPLRKRLLFGAIVATLSVGFFLGALEVGLRLVGYGHETRFFRIVRETDGRRWARENRDFMLTYFAPEVVRRPPPFRIPATKEPGTYRIFILGGSAAMGDPAPAFSLARTLELMLRDAYPDRKFEVVNAAVTAINSHVVRAIAADCADLEPDLFIVYAGNNEVIGPFGPAAVFGPFMRSAAAIDLVVGIKRTRTGQLIAALARSFGHDRLDDGEWRGMRMFLQHEMPVDDPRLRDVRSLFAGNLRAIAASGRSADARTLFCTVLTNQRDFAPFLSRHRPGLSAGELRRWEERFDAGNRAAADGDMQATEAAWRSAWAIDDQYAELAYRLGHLCLLQGNDNEARHLLHRALDCDALRFRTDSQLNAAIATVAAEGVATTELVDLAQLIAESSPHQIIGSEALYEHVHLTFLATWQAARELFARVSEDLERREIISAPAGEPLSFEDSRSLLGFTVYEQSMIADEMLSRLSVAPFTAQSDHEARVARWQQQAALAAQMLASPERQAMEEALYKRAIARSPDDWMLARNYGWALTMAFNAPERAIPLLERVLETVDYEMDTLFALATALRATGDVSAANRYFARLGEINPRYPGLPDQSNQTR